MQTDDDVLSKIFSPRSVDEFLTRYFEREVLHISRNDAGYFADVFGIADVEDILHVGGAQRERFSLVKEGVPLPVDDYSIEIPPVRSRHTRGRATQMINPRMVLTHFDQGYTLVISDATLFSGRLQRLCNHIQQRLGYNLIANVYFTPPSAQGFAIHHDTHGTLVLQIDGRKVWRIYEPVMELPVEAQSFSKNLHTPRSAAREVALEPGDTLYIPQGFAHEARSGERSLHVTLALTPPRVAELLDAVMQLAVIGDVELRRALPVGWHTSAEYQHVFAKRLAESMARALTPARVALAAEMLLTDLSNATHSTAHGTFNALQQIATPEPSSVLRIRGDAPYLARPDGENVKLTVADRTFTLPQVCGTIIEGMRGDGVRFSEVQGALGDEGAADFVKFLALLGLLSGLA